MNPVNPVGPNGPEIAALQEQLQAAMLRGGGANRVVRTPNGTVVRPLSNPFLTRRRGGSAAPFPFKLTDVSASGQLRVALYTAANTGFVNGIRPTVGVLPITNPAAYLTLTASSMIVLKATRDFTTTPSTFTCVVESHASPTLTEIITASTWTSYLRLGFATIDSGAMTLVDYDDWPDLSVENYGGLNLWYAAPRS